MLPAGQRVDHQGPQGLQAHRDRGLPPVVCRVAVGGNGRQLQGEDVVPRLLRLPGQGGAPPPHGRDPDLQGPTHLSVHREVEDRVLVLAQGAAQGVGDPHRLARHAEGGGAELLQRQVGQRDLAARRHREHRHFPGAQADRGPGRGQALVPVAVAEQHHPPQARVAFQGLDQGPVDVGASDSLLRGEGLQGHLHSGSLPGLPVQQGGDRGGTGLQALCGLEVGDLHAGRTVRQDRHRVADPGRRSPSATRGPRGRSRPAAPAAAGRPPSGPRAIRRRCGARPPPRSRPGAQAAPGPPTPPPPIPRMRVPIPPRYPPGAGSAAPSPKGRGGRHRTDSRTRAPRSSRKRRGQISRASGREAGTPSPTRRSGSSPKSSSTSPAPIRGAPSSRTLRLTAIHRPSASKTPASRPLRSPEASGGAHPPGSRQEILQGGSRLPVGRLPQGLGPALQDPLQHHEEAQGALPQVGPPGNGKGAEVVDRSQPQIAALQQGPPVLQAGQGNAPAPRVQGTEPQAADLLEGKGLPVGGAGQQIGVVAPPGEALPPLQGLRLPPAGPSQGAARLARIGRQHQHHPAPPGQILHPPGQLRAGRRPLPDQQREPLPARGRRPVPGPVSRPRAPCRAPRGPPAPRPGPGPARGSGSPPGSGAPEARRRRSRNGRRRGWRRREGAPRPSRSAAPRPGGWRRRAGPPLQALPGPPGERPAPRSSPPPAPDPRPRDAGAGRGAGRRGGAAPAPPSPNG